MTIKFVIATKNSRKPLYWSDDLGQFTWSKHIQLAKRFDTYQEAETFLTNSVPNEGYFQIEKLFIK